MKRVLPAPLVSAALFVLWLVLNGSVSAGHLVLALVLAVAVPILCAPLRPLPVRVRNPLAVLRLIGVVTHDVVASNVEVGVRIVHARRRPPRGAFVRIPLDLQDANGIAVLALITTIVPGTVWSELARDRSAFLLHVFDLVDEAEFIAFFKRRYERPLLDIFE
ncbi:MAG TPA: Na+/H+ antiporter subunit E [Casimicrobiaceae bacterium]|nr:Na+/H+ antiporter subunit E [Casimicrobiaceae bacterium]